MFNKYRFVVIIVLSLSFTNAKAQQTIGVGASGVYDFQTEGIAYGVRGYFEFIPHWAIVPQFANYMSFNKINEYYLGATVQYNYSLGRTTFYLLLGGAYNRWINYKDYHNKYAQLNNFAEEGGLGIMYSWRFCLNPFAEIRYNLNWKESNGRIGVLYFFKGCDGKNKHSRRRKGGKSTYCPAYF